MRRGKVFCWLVGSWEVPKVKALPRKIKISPPKTLLKMIFLFLEITFFLGTALFLLPLIFNSQEFAYVVSSGEW